MQNCHLLSSYLQKKPKKPSLEELSDEQLFQQALEGVVPLKNPDISDSRKPRRSLPKKALFELELIHADESTELSSSEQQHSIDDNNAHRKNGVQLRILKKLKRGHFPIEDEFDLHHLNTQSGRIALLDFISYCLQQNYRCVRIIHGKGLHSSAGPKLKLMSRELLRSHRQVMAFASCKQNEGGDGATDVLLKS